MPKSTVDDGKADDARQGELEGEPEARSARVIRYAGTADERLLTINDFERTLAPRDGRTFATVVWNKANDFRVPVTDLDFLDRDEYTRIITNDANLIEEDGPAEEPAEDVKPA